MQKKKMDCDREGFFPFSFFPLEKKNDDWKPAARFITYEFEQLVRRPSPPPPFLPSVNGDRI